MTNEDITIARASKEELEKAAAVLVDPNAKIALRFRALFLLRNADPNNEKDMAIAAKAMVDCVKLPGIIKASALLKHECAYCLGQIGAHKGCRTFVVPDLFEILCDKEQPVIARHEAGEALGAIGAGEYLADLEKIAKMAPCDQFPIEVTQTCELAVDRIKYIESDQSLKEKVLVSPFDSVDPAPPEDETMEDVKQLGNQMCDLKNSLFNRYKAMFSLRNIAGANADQKVVDEAVRQIVRGFENTDPNEALLRHEVAFVLGQLGDRAENVAVPSLLNRLEDPNENPMVRHEAAEALGSVASDEYSEKVLQRFATDNEPVVSESCVVALDIAEYEKSESFDYATLN